MAIVEEVPCRGGKGREKVYQLDGASFNWNFLSASPKGSLTCVVASSYRFLTVSMASVEAKVVHDPEHSVMVCGVKS